MSYVTGVVLQFSVCEDLDKFYYKGSVLKDLSDYADGSKHPQLVLFCGGFNYADTAELISAVDDKEWDCPEQVVLTLTTEQDKTRIFRFNESRELIEL